MSFQAVLVDDFSAFIIVDYFPCVSFIDFNNSFWCFFSYLWNLLFGYFNYIMNFIIKIFIIFSPYSLSWPILYSFTVLSISYKLLTPKSVCLFYITLFSTRSMFQMQARWCTFLHFFLKIICILQNFKQNANIPNVNVPKHSTDAMSPKHNSSLLPLTLYFILSFLSQCISVPCPKPSFIHFILLTSNCHQFLLIVIHKYTLLMSSSIVLSTSVLV